MLVQKISLYDTSLLTNEHVLQLKKIFVVQARSPNLDGSLDLVQA
jgi:hypothetical protein